ncbi:MAG: NlpC/P60 family protein [Anaerovoracaceae bacterium]|jgi:cell wall-associated NlpC family hydrolase
MKLKNAILYVSVLAMLAGMPTGAFAQDVQSSIDMSPGNVRVQDLAGYGGLRVSWDKVAGATAYRVYMSSSSDGDYKLVKTTSSNSCAVGALPTGATKFFKVETVAAENGTKTAAQQDGETDNISSPVSGKPMLDRTKTKTRLQTGTKARVYWKRVSGASGYTVYRRNPGSSWKRVRTVKSGKTVKLTKGGLARRKKHQFKVVPYRNVSGKKVQGYASSSTIYVPKVLKTSTKTYKYTNQAKVIRKGRTKLGCRYVWGAEGPNRFDCSGFTWWTLRHAGVSGVRIKRTSAQGMYNRYKKYSIGRNLNNAQPGDMLLFGRGRSRYRIFHVGLYYGSGKYIHANGTRVTISRVPRSQLVSIIRLKGLK